MNTVAKFFNLPNLKSPILALDSQSRRRIRNAMQLQIILGALGIVINAMILTVVRIIPEVKQTSETKVPISAILCG